MAKTLTICNKHSDNGDPHCLSCRISIDWNVMRQYCHCGAPATGYRTLGVNIETEFFCDEHFQGVPVNTE